MSSKNNFRNSPKTVAQSLQRPEIFFVRDDHLFATNVPRRDIPVASFSAQGKTTTVYNLDSSSEPLPVLDEVIPVYRLQNQSGQIAIPTGKIFLRLKENVSVRSVEAELAHLGYEIEQLVKGAPHAAWLTACDGSITASLSQLETLAMLRNVENYEPQMLMETFRK